MKRIKQILNILLENSYKYTAEGSISVKMQVEEEVNNQYKFVLSVSDTGKGIPD